MNGARAYVLDGHEPRPMSLKDQSDSGFELDVRRVARHEIAQPAGLVVVSTVFLGFDTARDGPPMVFETRVFGGLLDGETRHYATWAEAEAGHDELRRRVMPETGGLWGEGA